MKHKKVEAQVKLIKKFTSIAEVRPPSFSSSPVLITHALKQECLQLNNFNGLLEIIAGLNSHSVSRLEKTWDETSQKTKKKLAELDKVMSLQHNRINYRQRIAKANLPCMPYLGSFLADLTFIEEANPALTESEGAQLVNVERLELLARTVQLMRVFQVHTLALSTHPHHELIFSIMHREHRIFSMWTKM